MKNILTLSLVLFLTSCVADPRRDASAYATRQQADAQAAQSAQDLATQKELDAIKIQNAERQAEINASIQAASSRALNVIVTVAGIAGAVAVVAVILSTGAGASYAIVGAGKALGESAQLKARQVTCDPQTGTYPLLAYQSNGIYTLANPDDKSVMVLDSKQDADRDALKLIMATRYAGVVARHAENAEKKVTTQPSNIAEMMGGKLIIDAEAKE